MSHLIHSIDERPISARELAGLTLGKKIGEGASRDVYECSLNDKVVIKYEVRGKMFQNVMEWNIWQEVKDTKYASWFAQCLDISPCGLFLVMEKISIPDKKMYPKKVPEFFTDLKYNNFGMVVKQLVAVDYGFPIIFKDNDLKKKKKAEWWSE